MCIRDRDNIGDQTVYARGVLVNRGQNKKGSDDIVSNGSIIHVYDNQFMILVDGGKKMCIRDRYKIQSGSVTGYVKGDYVVVGDDALVPVSYTHLDVYKRQL